MCNFASGPLIQNISTGDVNHTNRSPGLQRNNKLTWRSIKQQLEELLIQSDIILQNSIHLQVVSESLLQNSLRLQDLCVIAEDNESMSEELEKDSMTHHIDSMPQEKENMTEETSCSSRSG